MKALGQRLCGLALAGTAGVVQAGDPFAGAAVYAEHCAVCHGTSGTSTMVGVPDFSRGEALQQPDMVLLGTIRAGKGLMPAFRGLLTDEEILDVIAYIRTFQ